MGRRRGAERVRNGGVCHRRLGCRCAGSDRRRSRQLHSARRRQQVQPARSPRATRRTASPATTTPGTDVQQRGLAAPSKIKGNGEFNPGVGGPLMRDKLWFFVSGKYVFADNFVAGMFFNENANKPTEWRYVRSTRQAILHQDQQIFQARLTYQLNQKNKFGFTFDQEAYCGCPNGVTATTSPDGAVDRRFPTQRFVTADWTSPVTNRLLLEASGIHRVERWGGMHLQTGKGENIDAITAGHDLRDRQPEPGDRRKPHLSDRRAVQQLVELEHPLSGGGLVHHRLAQLQGRLQQRLPPPREHDLHRSGRAVQLHFAERDPDDQSRIGSRRARSRSTSITTSGCSRRIAGRSADGPCRAASATTRSRTATRAQSLAPDGPRANAQRPVRPDRQPERGRTSRRRWAPPTTCSATGARR